MNLKEKKTEVRRDQILSAALRVAERSHYEHMTRDEVANAAECPATLIAYHFGTMIKFRRDVMRAAVRMRNLTVVAQGLISKDPHALKAPQDMKNEIARSISGV